MTVDWFTFWTGIAPHSNAITTLIDEKSFSYQQIQEKGCQTANLLTTKYQLKKGDRIVIVAQNCIEYIYLFAAAQKCGVILVPLNYRLTNHELSKLIIDAEPSLIIIEESYELKDQTIPTIELVKFSTELESYSDTFSSIKIIESDPVFILYTSGSTGFPKGVLYTHKMLFWNSVNTSVSLGINNDSIALVCMPPFHTGGWNVLLTPILHHGGHVILSKKFDAKETLDALEKYNCNQFMGVPTMLKMLSEEPSFDAISLPNLSYIIVGGEAMPLDLIEVYENKNIAIRQGFGMTEVGPNLTSLHHSQSKKKIGSIGKPNMYVSVKLINKEGETVPNGQLGELCFAGPVVMPSYWKKPKKIENSNDDNWFRSGDIAMMDQDGFIYIKDRIKNMFISGGENVYPAEIERILNSHPLVKDALIVGIKDDKWGEVGKAFIVLKGQVSKDELISFCKEKLSKFKIPKQFVFIDELPLNATGKVDRTTLRKM